MDRAYASRIYTALLAVSYLILDALKLQREPMLPVVRKRPWVDHGPKGVAYHYTGGPSGLKSMKWMNAPDWGNDQSSCHVMILDRTTPDKLGKLWTEQAGPELHHLFPAPTIILCPWNTGTWATNWINGWCLGVETRNVGYHVAKYPPTGKSPVTINGRKWEPYTREQLVAAINIGRLVHAQWPELWDSRYVVGHSMICCEKADPGPHFPLRLIRSAVDRDAHPETLEWLLHYDRAPDGPENDAWWEIDTSIVREEHLTPRPWSHASAITVDDATLTTVAAQLYSMGYQTGPEMPSKAIMAQQVEWFQRSTHYYRVASRRLKVDGDPGTKTQAALTQRLRELGLAGSMNA